MLSYKPAAASVFFTDRNAFEKVRNSHPFFAKKLFPSASCRPHQGCSREKNSDRHDSHRYNPRRRQASVAGQPDVLSDAQVEISPYLFGVRDRLLGYGFRH
jgi:hypothetical protein